MGYGSMATSDENIASASSRKKGSAAACDDVIERLTQRSRKFQFIAAGVAGLANASDAVEVLCLSFVLDQIEGITDYEKGAF